MSFSPARPGADEFAPFYAGYIHRVPDGDVLALLAEQGEETQRRLGQLTPEQALYRYAPGKWSVKEVLGHMCDTERIFAYRALRIARGDETPLPGFDENLYVPAGKFDSRELAHLLAELATVRAATLSLLRTFDEAAWMRRGLCNNHPVSARALAYITVGHERHHLAILAERYGLGA